jgi:hypothetical protein
LAVGPLVFLALLQGGCIAYVHDKKSESLVPAKVALADFAGSYREQALYHTPANKLGLMGHARLSSAIGGILSTSVVNIAVSPNGDIVVTSDRPGTVKLTFVQGRDYEFVANRIVFRFKGKLDSHDSPGVAVWKRHMQWLLDDSGRLHVLTSSKGIGMLTIIPAAALGGTALSIFERAAPRP